MPIIYRTIYDITEILLKMAYTPQTHPGYLCKFYLNHEILGRSEL